MGFGVGLVTSVVVAAAEAGTGAAAAEPPVAASWVVAEYTDVASLHCPFVADLEVAAAVEHTEFELAVALQNAAVVLSWIVAAVGIAVAFLGRYSVVDIELVDHWIVRLAADSVVGSFVVVVVLRTAVVAENTVVAAAELIGIVGTRLPVEVPLAAGTVGIQPRSAADFVVAEFVAVETVD